MPSVASFADLFRVRPPRTSARWALLAGLTTVLAVGLPARGEAQSAVLGSVRPVPRVPGGHAFAPLAPLEIAGRPFYPYAFDGHVHTEESPDADHPPHEVLEGAARVGLDALVFTDHGSPHAKLVSGRLAGVHAFAGQEIGGPFGHAVFWNVSDKQLVAPSRTSLAERAAFAHAHGGLVVLCHPGWWIEGRAEDPIGWMTPEALAKGGLSGDIDALELWNGVYDAPLRKLIGLWESALEAGVFVPIVGNSDFHRFRAHRLGGPRNVAHCERPEPERCLWDAVKAGRLFVTDGPSLLFSADDKAMGETLESKPGASLRVHVSTASPRGGELRVLLGRTRVRTVPLPVNAQVDEQFELAAPGSSSYLRVEIVRGEPEVVELLSNVIRVKVVP